MSRPPQLLQGYEIHRTLVICYEKQYISRRLLLSIVCAIPVYRLKGIHTRRRRKLPMLLTWIYGGESKIFSIWISTGSPLGDDTTTELVS